jgi:hypothetical protein
MEYVRNIDLPVAADSDVIIAGSGPAGVCAAIAAARTGAKTVLLESAGCLGGTWTAGHLGWIIDFHNKTGMLVELVDKLRKRGSITERSARSGSIPFNPEGMKCLLEDLCEEAGVRIRLHTMVTDVVKHADGTVAAVVTESKSGPECWLGKVFIDATGDGDLAALSGCGYSLGNGQNRTQPMSLLALVCGIQPGDVEKYTNNYTPRMEAIENLLVDFAKVGISPSYKHPSLFHLVDDLFFLMANHQYGYSGINADDVTRATIDARKEINLQIDGLRSLGGAWKNIQLASTGQYIGVREGRRIKGLYEVTLDDLRDGARHDDAICRSTFGVDVHALDAAHGSIEAPPCKAKPYDIPLRALISADVDNMMMAGRCISGDFYAHASYRVTGNAAVMGEAAGVCAGLAAQAGVKPKDLDQSKFFAKYPRIEEL